jgi:ferric-chelate reductase
VPHNVFMKAIATTTAIFREASYPHFSPAKAAFWVKVPPLGTILLLLTYLGFVLALEFINNDIPGAQHYTAIGVRAAWLAVAQIPLLILLAGKNNLIGLLTGVSYARLNILHRWVARMLLLLATIHFGSQNYGWNEYGLMQLEWATDTCPPTGIATYAILLWINLSTLAPLRNLSYEFFVVQHLLTFFGFIIAVMFHLPSTALYSRVYVYIPIALYILDRLVRTFRYVFNNIRPGRASLQALEGGVTKIRISNKQIKKWAPGSFVLLSIPRLGIGQSHPATIASITESHNGDLVFILKSHKGFTGRMFKSATSSTAYFIPHESLESQNPCTHTALIDGPYGGSHADLGAFDTVVLIAGSTGVTFTLSQFLAIAHRASSQKLPVRRLAFIWIVKSASWTAWVADELASSFKQAESAGIDVSIQVFVTCDERFTNADADAKEKECGCACDKSLGPCCCINVDETEGDETGDSIPTSNEQQQGSEKKPMIISRRLKSPRDALSCATFHSGRPSLYHLVSDAADQAQGEMGIAVCGPIGLSTSARTTVAKISDERAVHKGTGAQGIYLHVENFCW